MPDPNPSAAVLLRLTAWSAQQDAVRAMLLTSTRAVPHAPVDLFSDYDVVLVVPDIHPFYADRTWVEAFGRVLVPYWDPIAPAPGDGLERFVTVIQYEDGLKIDFTLWPVALVHRIVADPVLPAELDAGYRVLLDKDGLTTGLRAPTYRGYLPTPPTAATYQTWIEEFFSDVPYVAKSLWRDELLPAKWVLDADMKHVYLRRVLEWRMELDHQWAAPAGALGKGLKTRLPPALWAQLESTFTGADLAHNWAALYQTVALFRRVASEVGEALGYAYPQDLDRRVMAYAQKVQRLDRRAAAFG